MEKLKFKKVEKMHQWVEDNMRHDDGTVYACRNLYYEVHLNGEHIGDVFEGSFKSSMQARRDDVTPYYWAAYKDGEVVGMMDRTRKKVAEQLR